MPDYTDDQKRIEALREVHYRKRTYAQMLRQGTIDQAEVDYRIGIMQEIAEDYAERAEVNI